MPNAPRQFQARPAQPRIDHRPASKVRGYDARHQQWAEAVKDRDCWLCVPCKAAGRLVPCRYADHSIPRHVAPERAYDLTNGSAMCSACHARKTHSDNAKYGSAAATTLTPAQQRARQQVGS